MKLNLHVSLNDEVKVKLTPRGWQAYREYYQITDVEFALSKGIPVSMPMPRVDPDGYAYFQLWTLLNIFGPVTTMGKPIMFERNEIVIGVS